MECPEPLKKDAGSGKHTRKFAKRSAHLPDPHAVLRLEVELVAGRDVERFVPSVDVADRVAAIFAWRVGVGRDLFAERGFVLESSPALGEGEEEALLASESADHRVFFPLQ